MELKLNEGKLEDLLRDMRVGDIVRRGVSTEKFEGYISNLSNKYGTTHKEMRANWYVFQAYYKN